MSTLLANDYVAKGLDLEVQQVRLVVESSSKSKTHAGTSTSHRSSASHHHSSGGSILGGS